MLLIILFIFGIVSILRFNYLSDIVFNKILKYLLVASFVSVFYWFISWRDYSSFPNKIKDNMKEYNMSIFKENFSYEIIKPWSWIWNIPTSIKYVSLPVKLTEKIHAIDVWIFNSDNRSYPLKHLYLFKLDDHKYYQFLESDSLIMKNTFSSIDKLQTLNFRDVKETYVKELEGYVLENQ